MFAQSSLLVIAAVVNILYFNVLAAHHSNAFEARVAVGVTRWIAHIVAALAAQATATLDGEVILAFHTTYSW